ncbi:MAG: lipoprotein-releasing ABC transporter permease subunit [Bryobacter sp.]
MAASFEFFVAARYLRAKRRQAAIGLITVISVLGVAAGVMALIIAISINNGFRTTLQRNLLGATAHVTVTEAVPGSGISTWRDLVRQIRATPGTTDVSPALYEKVFLSSGTSNSGAILKGLDLENPRTRQDLVPVLRQGSLDVLGASGEGQTQILLGAKLAAAMGLRVGNYLQVINPMGELTPFGYRPSYFRARVGGIVETNFYDVDANFAFLGLGALQQMMGLGDVVNAVEVKLADINQAPAMAEQLQGLAGKQFSTTHWMEQNKQLLGALRMERIVSIITISLIQMVAALNIFITLIMLVMEKQRDIALLLSMGARSRQIHRIFLFQGLLIGATGSALGLLLGYGISYLADRYRLITLSEEIYSIPYVPFEPRALDALWITAFALLVSLLATLYPARSAARIAPAEALRYE